MNPTYAGERVFAAADQAHCDPEAIEFVRFCYRRRKVGWPELYDEMCAVAGRSLYQGYGADELAEIGITLGLFQMPALAVLASRVVAEDLERRRRTAAAIRATLVDASAEAEPGSTGETLVRTASVHDGPVKSGTTEAAASEHGTVRLIVGAGA
jgi:hypothetical protein